MKIYRLWKHSQTIGYFEDYDDAKIRFDHSIDSGIETIEVISSSKKSPEGEPAGDE